MPKIFPPVYALCFAVLMYLIADFMPILRFSVPIYLVFVPVIIGFLIDFYSLILFIRSKTTFHPLKLDKAKVLVTTGMYRFSRNPMYLGLFLLLSGLVCYLGAVSVSLIPFIFAKFITEVQIKKEEQFLTKIFGKDYLNYQQRVRRWV